MIFELINREQARRQESQIKKKSSFHHIFFFIFFFQRGFCLGSEQMANKKKLEFSYSLCSLRHWRMIGNFSLLETIQFVDTDPMRFAIYITSKPFAWCLVWFSVKKKIETEQLWCIDVKAESCHRPVRHKEGYIKSRLFIDSWFSNSVTNRLFGVLLRVCIVVQGITYLPGWAKGILNGSQRPG